MDSSLAVELGAFISYFFVLSIIALLSYRKQKSEADYILGNRSLNFWLTALSAHASDMSSWLFLAYPALIFVTGVTGAWAAIGLTTFMFLNWHFVAPKLRIATEATHSLTLSTYFENRFQDKSGSLRVVSALLSLIFFTIYISSGLVAMGLLVESLFDLPYIVGISIGPFVVAAYVLCGGYRTVAWIDLFQGFFLLGVIMLIPSMLLVKAGGMGPIMQAVSARHLTTSLLPHFAPKDLLQYLFIALGWGLGYFGQPQILTKFMGIHNVKDMSKAKYLGISWQALALFSATIIGLIGIYTFPNGNVHPEHIILEIVKTNLPSFFAGLVLCAILAATTNVMAAQILVAASNLSEDLYKQLVDRHASSHKLLWISRGSVVLITIGAFIIAFLHIASIYNLVFYAWSGLGSAFGPLLLLSLYRKTINKYGAFCGILVGGLTAMIWPYYNNLYNWDIPSLIPGFILGILAIEGVSFFTRRSRNIHT